MAPPALSPTGALSFRVRRRPAERKRWRFSSKISMILNNKNSFLHFLMLYFYSDSLVDWVLRAGSDGDL